MNITVVQVVNPLQKLNYVQQHVACFCATIIGLQKRKKEKSTFNFLYLIIVRQFKIIDLRLKYQIEILIL
jgi:hypothetical protein